MSFFDLISKHTAVITNYSNAVDAISCTDHEDNLKPPMKTLLEALDPDITVQLEKSNEVGNPDITISRGDATVGHIELKNTSKSGDTTVLKSEHDRSQWKRFQTLPNIAYCNGTQITLWRNGEPCGAANLDAPNGCG